MAELWGVFHGLSIAIAKGFNFVELSIDSQVIGNNLQRNGFSGSIVGRSLFSSIAYVLSFFTLVNRVAYGLARLGFDVDGGLIIYDHVLEVIKPLIAVDCL